MTEIFSGLSANIPFPVIVVIHRLKNVRSNIEEILQSYTSLKVKEAEDKEKLQAGCIYISPANYHLLVERNGSVALSTSEAVNYSRPSIDVCMISVAEAYAGNCIGIVCTGANKDGSNGLRYLQDVGSICIVQDPNEAQVRVMPDSALEFVPEALTLKLHEIAQYLSEISQA